ncbi:MAG: ATP--cob(I)alamin adenosyltransferase [Chthonomonas sp.]
MRIYTTTGDDGTTGLYGGTRISKASLRTECLGTLDELNCAIGLVLASGPTPSLVATLGAIQHRLFDLGAEVGCAPGKQVLISVGPEDIQVLEKDIDRMEADLPALDAFILPGGKEPGARLHMARAVCRRAERLMVALSNEEPLRRDAMAWINRLSDWLFVAARYANRQSGVPDTKWSKT